MVARLCSNPTNFCEKSSYNYNSFAYIILYVKIKERVCVPDRCCTLSSKIKRGIGEGGPKSKSGEKKERNEEKEEVGPMSKRVKWGKEMEKQG